MQRGQTGSYETSVAGGETVRAFVPHRLPPMPALVLDPDTQRLLDAAMLACGRLDGIASLLPDPDLFLYAYVRREAVLSSQIEGTQSSLSDLLLFELDEAPGVPFDDVVEVSNYVAACELGVQLLADGLPISTRLLLQVHGRLLARGRGAKQSPGEYRRTQNWIGGTRPGNAMFVPPPPNQVANCIADLERFIHAQDDSLPLLVRAALVHVQFETIHPFLDGNGRVGRLLIILMLIDAGVLRQPLLYLSLFFKQHRGEYYRLLSLVRETGDWEAWISFFLEGVTETANAAVDAAHRLLALVKRDEARIAALGAGGTGLARIYASLRARPVANMAELCTRAGVTFPTASKAIDQLITLGIACEITGKKRARVFAYDGYLAVLNEGVGYKMS
jgi:Fic family protein